MSSFFLIFDAVRRFAVSGKTLRGELATDLHSYASSGTFSRRGPYSLLALSEEQITDDLSAYEDMTSKARALS